MCNACACTLELFPSLTHTFRGCPLSPKRLPPVTISKGKRGPKTQAQAPVRRMSSHWKKNRPGRSLWCLLLLFTHTRCWVSTKWQTTMLLWQRQSQASLYNHLCAQLSLSLPFSDHSKSRTRAPLSIASFPMPAPSLLVFPRNRCLLLDLRLHGCSFLFTDWTGLLLCMSVL